MRPFSPRFFLSHRSLATYSFRQIRPRARGAPAARGGPCRPLLRIGITPPPNRRYLHLNQLSGPIPAELAKLATLQALYLRGNHLSGPIPGELGKLASLEELYLDGNQLRGLIPGELGKLASLVELNLGGNELNGTIPGDQAPELVAVEV